MLRFIFAGLGRREWLWMAALAAPGLIGLVIFEGIPLIRIWPNGSPWIP